MVMRTSQALQVPQYNLPEIGQVGPGNIRPEASNVVGDGGDAYQDKLIQGIVGTATNLATQGFQHSTEEAYLAGQAKAGQIETEAQLQSSPLTKDWAVAGYRDAMARLKIADSEAQFKTDLQWLRQESPEKLNEYLAKRRADHAGMLEGMSRSARESTLGQLLMNDRAAIAEHTVAHVGWQRELIATGYQKEFDVAKEGAKAAERMDGQVGVDTMRAAVGRLSAVLAAVANDDRLDQKTREEMFVSGMESALADNLTALPAYMRGSSTDLGDAEPGIRSVFGKLSLKSQEAIAKAEHAAKTRTESLRNGQLAVNLADLEHSVNTGAYTGTRDDIIAFGQRLIKEGLFTFDSFGAFMRRMDSAMAKNSQGGTPENLQYAVLAYHPERIAAAGLTDSEATNRAVEFWTQKGVPRAGQVGMLMASYERGNKAALTALGKVAGGALTSIVSTEGMAPERLAEVTSIANEMDKLKDGWDGPLGAAVLSEVEEPLRGRFLSIYRSVAEGKDIRMAINDRVKQEELDNRASRGEKLARTTGKAKDVEKLLDGRYNNGVDPIDHILSVFPSKANQYASLPDNTGIPGTGAIPSATTAMQVARARAEVRAEAYAAMERDTTLSPKDAILLGEAAVAQRSLRMPSGTALIFPQGTTPQGFFGNLKYTKEEIAKALDATVRPETAGGIIRFEARNGQIVYQEENSTAERMSLKAGILTRDAILPALRAPQANYEQQWKQIHVGVEYTDPVSKETITISGRTTAPVAPSVAFELRKNLAKNEGVRSTFADDAGQPATGVGVRHKAYLPKAGPDGKVSRRDIEASMNRASDDALKHGENIRQRFGFKNERATLLFAEMAYQTGPLDGKDEGDQYLKMLTVPKGNPAAAVQAFRQTGVFKSSGKERRNHYEKLINEFWR